QQIIRSAGTAIGTLLEDGGAATLLSHGTTISTTILGSGSYNQVTDGFASATIISSGGLQDVVFGSASATVILSGGTEHVAPIFDPSHRPKSFNAVISGGEQDVSATGSAVGTIIYTGSEVVSSAGTAINTTV